MDLTPERKEIIDSKSYVELLRPWRFAKAGDPWFQGETGEYWKNRIALLQSKDPAAHVKASKAIGWGD